MGVLSSNIIKLRKVIIYHKSKSSVDVLKSFIMVYCRHTEIPWKSYSWWQSGNWNRFLVQLISWFQFMKVLKKKTHPQIIGRTYHKELRYKIKDRHSRNRKIFLPHSTWFIYSCFVSVCWKLIFDHLSELASGLQNQRLPDGTTRDIGSLLVDWVSII